MSAITGLPPGPSARLGRCGGEACARHTEGKLPHLPRLPIGRSHVLGRSAPTIGPASAAQLSNSPGERPATAPAPYLHPPQALPSHCLHACAPNGSSHVAIANKMPRQVRPATRAINNPCWLSKDTTHTLARKLKTTYKCMMQSVKTGSAAARAGQQHGKKWPRGCPKQRQRRLPGQHRTLNSLASPLLAQDNDSC